MTPPPIDRLISLVLTAWVVARFAWRFGREAGFGARRATCAPPFGGWGRPQPGNLNSPARALLDPFWVHIQIPDKHVPRYGRGGRYPGLSRHPKTTGTSSAIQPRTGTMAAWAGRVCR